MSTKTMNSDELKVLIPDCGCGDNVKEQKTGQGSKVQTLESFMVANAIASIPALLAKNTNFQMIDPESSKNTYELSDLGYYKITNLIKSQYIKRLESLLALDDFSNQLGEVKFTVDEFFFFKTDT